MSGRFIERHKKEVEERGYEYICSYLKGDITIDKNKKIDKNVQIRVKCPYCKSEYDIERSRFVYRKDNCTKCCNKYENSFAYYIQQELNESLNKYWDWEKNKLNPYLIYPSSDKSIWIKCDKTNYHKSHKTTPNRFIRNERCPYCSCKSGRVHPRDSFGQWCIDNVDKNFINKYWSNKNKINPFLISKSSHKKIWLKCQNKDYHGDYLTTPIQFKRGERCAYCGSKHFVHKLDSFGALCPETIKYWSPKNKKTPFEVFPNTNIKYIFICEDCGNEFERSIYNYRTTQNGKKCPLCFMSKGETEIKKYLDKKEIVYIFQKKFKNLLGINGRNLSYDFYLPQHNLLIEYQGEFHDGTANQQTMQEFEYQKEHDKRKREYAQSHNIDLLEIRYWDFNNIDNILSDYFLNKGELS